MENITSVLAGTFTFLLFASILEKNIQNVLLFPTSMGLKNHALSTFMNSHPIFLSFLAGLFPGLFEESGRFAAFKTLLKKGKIQKLQFHTESVMEAFKSFLFWESHICNILYICD